jgi:hypothetical protein
LTEVPSHILAASAAAVPSEEGLMRLRKEAQRWFDLETEIAALEKKLEERKAESNQIRQKTLPDLFAEIGTDNIGLPEAGEFGSDVVVENYYKAGITADWDEARRQRGFAELGRLGGDALIKTVVSVVFGKGEIEKARQLDEMIRASPIGNTHIPEISMAVQWNTLTSFLKERIEAGDQIENAEDLGLSTGRIAKIKPRRKRK